MVKKMPKRPVTEKEPIPQTVISNCTFTGSDRPANDEVIALARAIEANAEAIQVLAGAVARPGALLMINQGKATESNG